MSASSEKFLRIQQQFKECSQLEQLYVIVELTRSFQLSYQHFLIQLYQINIQNGNDVMFNHTVDDANSADIVTCLLSSKLEKILFTLQLYLPLIASKTFNENLFNAYRDVLIYLDANLSPKKFTYPEQQVINLAESVFFFIQTNPNLHKLLSHIPKLIYLIQSKTFHPDEPQQYHQPLQRFASNRSQAQPLMTCSSEGSPNASQLAQQLTRHETNDSGVDLTEPSVASPMQNLLSSHHQKNSFLEWNLSSTGQQKKHPFVGKTASSPIPEHATIDIPPRVPLTGVLSAPAPTTNYSDSRHRNAIYHQPKHVSSLAKSDEEEEESQPQIADFIAGQNRPIEQSKPLGQFHSLRYRTVRTANTENVSPYLGVDANSTVVEGTFIQPNTGMKDVPRWLKHLRLHKYNEFFSQLTYDEMMNLTNEQLKASLITEGACTKIVLHIKKLKERSSVLKQLLIGWENGQVDLADLIVQFNDLMTTPIRSKQLAEENHSDEDIPKLVVDVLEKVFQRLPSHALPEVYHSLLLLVDNCYRHEAFNEYINLFLQWRRRLSKILQSLGKIDFRPNQSTFYSNQQRRSVKPPVRPMKSSSAIYYSNPSSTSVPVSKYNSEPQNNFLESTLIRRPTRSPPQMFPTTEESNDSNLRPSTVPTNHGAYLVNHQHQALTRKASIDPHGESNSNNKAKLCKTASDPHRIHFQNLPPSPLRSQQSAMQMISTPYSQQQRLFISRSPPLPTADTLTVSPIKKCHSDNDRSVYYGSPENPTSFSNSDDQRQTNTDDELFYHQITNKALGDDVNDSSMDEKEELTTKQSLTNSNDMEQ